MDIPSPPVTAGNVLVKVAAASVNYPDGLMVQGKYQIKSPLPFVPRVEIAGTVKAIGAGVTEVELGDRVMTFCGQGGFAEEALVEAKSVFKLSPSMDFAAAAAMPLTYGTTYHALLDRAKLQ